LIEIVTKHGGIWELHEWEDIAREMGVGMTVRQVVDRWNYYLRPGLSRGEFTIEERRQCLRASICEFGNWTHIASCVGDGHSRSCAQVKSVVNTLHAKLARLHIPLQRPDVVDSLPDSFFERTSTVEEMREIRQEFFQNRTNALQRQLGQI
jgi:hypothetical protein